MMKKRITSIFAIAALGLSSLSLASCGFTPVHQSHNGLVSQSFSKMHITSLNGDNPDDKEAGFDIKQSMIDRIGQGTGEHVLEITGLLRQRRLGITGDDIASRFEITLNAKYKLIDEKTGDTLHKGILSSKTSFGAPLDPFGRISAEENAAKRVAVDVADKLIFEMSEYYTTTSS